jgi:catechol 2,3-dioxygenase-like lactoylglutathione lyase family enzyme
MMKGLYARSVFFVADVARASQFYTEQLGFSEDWNSQDGVCQVSLLGFELILNEVGGQTQVRAGHGRVFIGLEDDQVRPLLDHVEARGIQTQRITWGQPTLVIKDPDGNELFLWDWPNRVPVSDGRAIGEAPERL